MMDHHVEIMRRGGGGAINMRRRHGGRAKSRRDLRRDVESAMNKYSSVEQLVDHLRSSDQHYSRLKRQPLTKSVEKILRRNESSDDGDFLMPKKRRKLGENDERLEQSDFLNSGSRGSPSSAASAPCEEKADLSSESTSVEYREKYEPDLDMMKSMLREKLSQKIAATMGKKSKKLEMNGQPKFPGDGLSNAKRKRSLRDLGGMNEVIEQLMDEAILPFCHGRVLRHLGVDPPTGILLHGPPGCGKTTLVKAIADVTGLPFYSTSPSQLLSGVSGESEANIQELFLEAISTAPSIVFIDKIDAIAPKKENPKGMENPIVSELIRCMDETHELVHSNASPNYVLVIGATSRPDALDPSLRMSERFCEFCLDIPDENARVQILSKLTCNAKCEGSLDLLKIARSTPGFVGADLKALVKMAGCLAMNRIFPKRKAKLNKIISKREVEFSKEEKDVDYSEDFWWSPAADEELEDVCITMADLEKAAKKVQPCTKREGFSVVPNVKWDDVGGLLSLKKEFDRHIIWRIQSPEKFQKNGMALAAGMLLYGPPGCGKTLIAKAVANEAGVDFIYVKGPEILNKYVGESELAVRRIFSRARMCSPCIIFFDEIDALATRRGSEGGWVVERVLNQILIELDGAEQRRGVYVIGATNRPEVLDPALLRSGRLGDRVYVPLPSPDERGLILKALARDKPIDPNVDLMAIGRDQACENFSGADLSALMNRAQLAALEESRELKRSCTIVKDAHFETAMENSSPSVSKEQIQYYEAVHQKLKVA